MRGLFLRQTELALPDSVLSATTEAGITAGTPVSATANAGSLRLRASGVPSASTLLDLALQRGGLPNGYSTRSSGTPGASLRVKQQSDSSSQWAGYIDPGYLTYARNISAGAIGTDYPRCSELRTLPNGKMGSVRLTDGPIVDSAAFLYKAKRSASYTAVTILASGVAPTAKPALVVTKADRLIAYIPRSAGVVAYYSDDNGLTWAVLSNDTGLGTTSSMCAEVVGDHVCVVISGTPDAPGSNVSVHWSLDGGATFTLAGTVSGGTMARTCVDATGQMWLFASITATTPVTAYRVGVGGNAVSSGLTVGTVPSGAPVFAATCHDDGTMWVFSPGSSGANDWPIRVLNASVSHDNGASWVEPGGSVSEIFDNQTLTNEGAAYGWTDITLGSWGGSLVLLGVSDGQTAAYDNTLQEVWFGGWDGITEYQNGTVSAATDGSDYYERMVYTAFDVPENVGFTRTDVGAGATVTITDDGCNIDSAIGVNTYYDLEGWAPTSGDSYRFRFVFRVNSGGDLTNELAGLFISISDTANRQWIRVRFSTDAIRLVDQSGTLATSASVSNQFTEHTELFVSFAHDTTAGQGTVSVWYRIGGNDHWTALATNQAVAEQAGNATELVRFGGSDAGAVDWDINLLGIAEGAGNLHDGFTNPDDLKGRFLSSSVNFFVRNNVRIGAFGGPGVKGDTFTYANAYHYARRNIWLNSRPSCHARSSADNADWRVVFGDAANSFNLNTAVVVGSNVPEIILALNATNSWASPSFLTKMSAVVWNGAVSAAGDGYLRTDGYPFLPHRFRSVEGRRWWVEIGAPPGLMYEIADNDTNEIRVNGLAAGGFVGGAIRIFGDRMGAVLPTDQTYLYASLLVQSMQTAEDYYRVGDFFLNRRHDIEEEYDTGFVDRYVPNVGLWETDAGYDTTALLGPEKHELRLAWGPVDRLSTSYLWRLVEFFRSLEGEHRPFVHWRDTSDPSTIEVYRAKGPPVKENVYGELHDELARLSQMIFRRVL
jgi:hypothetical protein